MGKCSGVWRPLMVAALVGLAVWAQGCAGMTVGDYFLHRGQDALECVEFGLTITDTPQWGFYWNSLGMGPGGWSKIDGYFLGVGGGQIGWTRHWNYCYGFMYTRENIGWGENADPNVPGSYYTQKAGILGYILPPYTPVAENYSPYTPACVHFFPHIAYVGAVWNVRWFEIIDFMTGWPGLDLSGDDGYDVGRWSFPRRYES